MGKKGSKQQEKDVRCILTHISIVYYGRAISLEQKINEIAEMDFSDEVKAEAISRLKKYSD